MMGKLLSSLCPSCVKAEKSESNPKEPLVEKDHKDRTYSSTQQDVTYPQTGQSLTRDSLETSSKSVYYTPSSSLTVSTMMEKPNNPLQPVEKESNALPC
ncbi:hypothetical protein AWC38_SpisGene7465 [Stylophora pistillata]|uniref:Uncharacterized protein n=1 Tax=Stylophora pistillata TaxID=50429 RepID=A0A2B4SG33_STYPI|nr:hypothetical protein AWC38_SpisGene7465 [Stylophora pistillata]